MCIGNDNLQCGTIAGCVLDDKSELLYHLTALLISLSLPPSLPPSPPPSLPPSPCGDNLRRPQPGWDDHSGQFHLPKLQRLGGVPACGPREFPCPPAQVAERGPTEAPQSQHHRLPRGVGAGQAGDQGSSRGPGETRESCVHFVPPLCQHSQAPYSGNFSEVQNFAKKNLFLHYNFICACSLPYVPLDFV